LLRNEDEQDDGGATGHHDERQPGAEFQRAERLQQGAQTADEKGGADELHRQSGRQSKRLGDQEDGCDRRCGHHKDVLQPEQGKFEQR